MAKHFLLAEELVLVSLAARERRRPERHALGAAVEAESRAIEVEAVEHREIEIDALGVGPRRVGEHFLRRRRVLRLCASGAGEALTSIIEIVRQVAEIAPKIASGSREQARSIAEINKALNDLDVATQQNAALVEESSAAAASLADQAGQLVAVASGFRGEAQAAA